MNIPWWGYVILAGLSWGTYVPIIFYGGSELGGKANARLMAILCVGVAYFVLAVVFPMVSYMTGLQEWPGLKTTGIVFSLMAGVAGAVGAICVIFASKSAVEAGTSEFTARETALVSKVASAPTEEAQAAANKELNDLRENKARSIAKYRLYIAPLIFCLAPLINTLLSSVWHPKPGDPFHFDLELPGWKMWLGILFVAVGTFLVLLSKEEAEVSKAVPRPAASNPSTP